MKILSIPMDAGGDLHPLVAASLGLRDRGHELLLYGEHSALRIVQDLELEKITAPADIDFSPRLIEALGQARQSGGETDGDTLERVLHDYSQDQAAAARRLVFDGFQPDLVMSSLVGAGIVRAVSERTGIPCCVVNSDFYIGPNPPRSVEEDFAPRSIPEIGYLGEQMQRADLVLHAVEQDFDCGFTGLPAHNHYVGPLIWEKPVPVPSYFMEPGNPWALVTISSQKQQDAIIGRLSWEALLEQPVRIVETIGRGHRRKEFQPVPKSVHLEHFAPHSRFLENCKLLVSHAGVGSVVKAMWYGVPMTLVPWGRDQPGVAARAERLGVANIVHRSELTEETLKRAIHEILDDAGYHEQAAVVSERLRQSDPVAVACDHIEGLLR